MHYYKINNEIMQYCIVSNDIALIMHYRALLQSTANGYTCLDKLTTEKCKHKANQPEKKILKFKII